ncbi:MAG: hypothetical protein AAGB51_10465 [Planctomycetota bacterium]
MKTRILISIVAALAIASSVVDRAGAGCYRTIGTFSCIIAVAKDPSVVCIVSGPGTTTAVALTVAPTNGGPGLDGIAQGAGVWRCRGTHGTINPVTGLCTSNGVLFDVTGVDLVAAGNPCGGGGGIACDDPALCPDDDEDGGPDPDCPECDANLF